MAWMSSETSQKTSYELVPRVPVRDGLSPDWMVDFTCTWSGLVPHSPEPLGEKTDDKHHISRVEGEVVRLGNTPEFFTTDPNLLSS